VTRPVLVVDDDPSVARLVRAVLEREGLPTELAPDGPAALQRLQRGGIALVLTDMTMPGMTGLELVRAAEARGLTTPFLLMSAFLDVETERTLFAEPAIAGVLRKPFELGRLLSDVQALLAAMARHGAVEDGVASGASAGLAAPAEECAAVEAGFALVPWWFFQPWPGPRPPRALHVETVAVAHGHAQAPANAHAGLPAHSHPGADFAAAVAMGPAVPLAPC
jgi:CheY-like chemotaxis protein